MGTLRYGKSLDLLPRDAICLHQRSKRQIEVVDLRKQGLCNGGTHHLSYFVS
jgi:hypothetical protein